MPCESGLKQNKSRGGDPINEGSCRPLVSKGEMEELKYSKERPKSIDEPVLIFLCDSSCKIEVVEKCCNYWQY